MSESMKFYSVEKLGPKRSRSPEGYLIVLDVPLARTGTQLYMAGEVPVPPGPDGVVRIERTDDEVFRVETIASANGKDLVDEHPMNSDAVEDGYDVNPFNYSLLTKGVILNPRRGTGADSDLLMGDVMIKDLGAIRAVEAGKVELSLGYNADYETLEVGRGKQRNIIINHAALVEAGRCGPRCAIGDEDTMRTRDERTVGRKTTTLDKAYAALDKIKRGWGARDEKLVEEGMKEVKDEMSGMTPEGPTPPSVSGEGKEGGDSHVHIHLNGAAGNGAGSGPGTASEADDAVDPAAAEAAGTPEERIAALEAGMKKIIEMLSGGGEEPEGEIAEDASPDVAEGEVEEDNPDVAATGDESMSKLVDDPVPAATGDKMLGKAVKDADGKVYLQKKTGDKRVVVGTVVRTRDGKVVFRKGVKVRDSAHLEQGFADVLARAEILVPGLKLPTYDAAAPATTTVKAMCDFRRGTLARALAHDVAQAHVLAIGGVRTKDALPAMTCDAVKILFNGASELARASNNGGARVVRTTDTGGAIKSTADVNKKNRELWGQPAR